MTSNPAPIATLSLNPAVDIAYLVAQLLPGDKSPSKSASYDPGGNSINVSRALKQLGKHSHACCILAGESGNLLRELLKGQVDHVEPVFVKGETRINCTIQQRRPPEEFKISGVGPKLNTEAVQKITHRFLEHTGRGYGILSGSLPDGVSSDLYSKLTRQLNQQGARAIVDTRSSMLLETIESRPFLIKPNRYELEVMCGRSLPTYEAVAAEARKIQSAGVKYVCVSLGAEGAILADADDSYLSNAPKIRMQCSVGAGDSLLAGLIAGLSEKMGTKESLRLGVACGSGTAAHPGTKLFEPDTLEDLKSTINVESLGI